MTENEARLILDVRISRFDHAGDVNEALEIAKQALEEIQQYRAIGTVEECREAVEKQKAKKVIDRDLDLGYYTCPSCGTAISFMEDGYKSHKFCLNCGQAILQENEDD